MSHSPHNEIIRQVCREILLPLGVFQKGSSRIYLDDNGWFFTVIEFQPSGFSKGTCLNIALHFLWNERTYLSYDFPCGPSRIKQFVEYQNEVQFAREVRQCAEAARRQILFYRELRNIRVAKRYAWLWRIRYHSNAHVQALRMIRQLDDEEVLQKIKRTRGFWRTQSSMSGMHRYDIYDYQAT